jgi:type IX secretion system PorP/SprF family membrane protein
MKTNRAEKRKLLLLIAFALCMGPGVFAQDIHFSQFFQAPLLRNPALAGIFTGDVRVQAVYRDQWNSVTDAYKTSSIEGEYKMSIGKVNDFLTAGVQVLYDKAGTIGWTSTQVFPALNYHKSLSAEKNKYLSLGFMGGIVQKRIDRSKMTTNSSYDNGTDGESFVNPSYIYFDGSVGLSFNSNLGENANNNYFLGVAYHHFNRPQVSFYRNAKIELFPKWVFSGGIRFGVSDYSYITIQADHSQQGGFNETVAGAMYGLKLGDDPAAPLYTIHGGAFLRWNDAIIPAIKLDYSPFSFTLSYDVNISKLKPSSYGRGGYEISVTYIGVRKNNSSVEYMRCPRF